MRQLLAELAAERRVTRTGICRERAGLDIPPARPGIALTARYSGCAWPVRTGASISASASTW